MSDPITGTTAVRATATEQIRSSFALVALITAYQAGKIADGDSRLRILDSPLALGLIKHLSPEQKSSLLEMALQSGNVKVCAELASQLTGKELFSLLQKLAKAGPAGLLLLGKIFNAVKDESLLANALARFTNPAQLAIIHLSCEAAGNGDKFTGVMNRATGQLASQPANQQAIFSRVNELEEALHSEFFALTDPARHLKPTDLIIAKMVILQEIFSRDENGLGISPDDREWLLKNNLVIGSVLPLEYDGSIPGQIILGQNGIEATLDFTPAPEPDRPAESQLPDKKKRHEKYLLSLRIPFDIMWMSPDEREAIIREVAELDYQRHVASRDMMTPAERKEINGLSNLDTQKFYSGSPL